MDDVCVEGIGGWITVAQAARLLGLTVSGVHKLVRRRNLPVLRVGGERGPLLVQLSALQAAR